MDENTPVSNQEETFEFDSKDLGYETEVTETPSVAEEVKEEVNEVVEYDFNKIKSFIDPRVKHNHTQGYDFADEQEFINTVQKGLNYDKVKNSKAMQYTEKKAQEFGLTVDQYIEELERYEQQQKEELYENKKADLLEKGISEEEANEMIEALRMKSTVKVENKREKELKEFVEEYPDIDYETIPEEVLKSDKPLKVAYLEYENKKTKQELEEARKLLSNKATSPVKPVTTTGAVEDEGEDLFMQGFNSR